MSPTSNVTLSIISTHAVSLPFSLLSLIVWEDEIRTACCGDVAVTHVSELDFPDADPPCHFCCEQASTAIHDESRLQIVSGGKNFVGDCRQAFFFFPQT